MLKKLEKMNEDLRNWFNPKHPDGGWKRINSKGEVVGPCARKSNSESKPKCMSNKKRRQLSKKQRAAAVKAKRRHDPVADRAGKGGKPINVSNFGKGRISEAMEYLEEKNVPTNPELWSKAKSLARSKFDVYPSAYANGWAAKWYKKHGGGWKKGGKKHKKMNEEYGIYDRKKKDFVVSANPNTQGQPLTFRRASDATSMINAQPNKEDLLVKQMQGGTRGSGMPVVLDVSQSAILTEALKYFNKSQRRKLLGEDHVAIESGEMVDDEGQMAANQLDTIQHAIDRLRGRIKGKKQQLPAWVQSKITKATDGIDTVADYMSSDSEEQLNEIFGKIVGAVKRMVGAKPKPETMQDMILQGRTREEALADTDAIALRMMKNKPETQTPRAPRGPTRGQVVADSIKKHGAKRTIERLRAIGRTELADATEREVIKNPEKYGATVRVPPSTLPRGNPEDPTPIRYGIQESQYLNLYYKNKRKFLKYNRQKNQGSRLDKTGFPALLTPAEIEIREKLIRQIRDDEHRGVVWDGTGRPQITGPRTVRIQNKRGGFINVTLPPALRDTHYGQVTSDNVEQIAAQREADHRKAMEVLRGMEQEGPAGSAFRARQNIPPVRYGIQESTSPLNFFYNNQSKKLIEMAQGRKESDAEYRDRLLGHVDAGRFSELKDTHDRIHAGINFLKRVGEEDRTSRPLVIRVKGDQKHARAMTVTGISGSRIVGRPMGAGGRAASHKHDVYTRPRDIIGIHKGFYSSMKPEHLHVLNSIFADETWTALEEETKKPFKGFKKGKNHPEGGLSRAEARRQGIHAGIETKREAQKKGGFGKLSGKTQKRRKSFCSRMCGMKRRRTSAKTARDPKSKINAALRVWGCRCESYNPTCDVCDYEKQLLMHEEVVNKKNKGTMTKGEISRRDDVAKKTKPQPIKGDTDEESKHRIATYIVLRSRGGAKKKKAKK
jgi:hypothetical protein